MRVVTLGSDDANHPLTRAARAVVSVLDGINHVDHLTTEDTREYLRDVRSLAFREHIAGLQPDLLLSAAYGRILPEDVLMLPTIGAVNVHPSLLPDYRGVQAVWWAIYEGCTLVGVTVHEMTPAIDTGPILGQASLEVTPDSPPVEVWRRLGELARPLLASTLEEIAATRRISGRPQPAGGSYRSGPQRELRRLEIDWSQSARELVRRDRIFRGYANIPVLRWRLRARQMEEAGETQRLPGSILRRRPTTLDVAAGEGTAVRLVLPRPLRAWTKLLLLHLATRRFRAFPATPVTRGATAPASRDAS